MLSKIQMTAFSPKILSLQYHEIAKYFENKGKSISKLGEWFHLEDKNGMETKIFKTGIIESEKAFEDFKVKEELMRISNDVKTISTNLFGVNPIYNVLISQDSDKCIKTFEKIDTGRNVTSLSVTLNKNIYVEIKIDSYECQINIIGISDTNDIMNIYNGIVNNDEGALKMLNLEHMSIKESVF